MINTCCRNKGGTCRVRPPPIPKSAYALGILHWPNMMADANGNPVLSLLHVSISILLTCQIDPAWLTTVKSAVLMASQLIDWWKVSRTFTKRQKVSIHHVTNPTAKCSTVKNQGLGYSTLLTLSELYGHKGAI